jgi:hypothetical protein
MLKADYIQGLNTWKKGFLTALTFGLKYGRLGGIRDPATIPARPAQAFRRTRHDSNV